MKLRALLSALTLVSLAATACKKSEPATRSDDDALKTVNAMKADDASKELLAEGAHFQAKNFALDVPDPHAASTTACHTGQICEMTIRLVPAAGYHVNKEYPYAFLANATAGVEFLGGGDASKSSFSVRNGSFTTGRDGAGVMAVAFKASKSGTVTISGTYKMSVCSADQCQIERVAVRRDVNVL